MTFYRILGILCISAGTTFMTTRAPAQSLPIDASAIPPKATTEGFKMGTPRTPDGRTLTFSNRSLLRDGKPWLPVMGEIHFARYPADQWRDEILKMKAGGIDIVATYVFWIHHEEVEGQFDWTGSRNLRGFIQACKDANMPVIVRLGPWCHGEVRNGGIPEWALDMGRQLRTTNPEFLAKARILYGQIAQQLQGMLWKDGGPVIGAQVDNEYRGPAAYLLELKKIAIESGIDVPIYTRTGWPTLSTPMPVGEIAPLYGAYSEGFWDRNISPMPGKYWQAFVFTPIRTDAATGTDVLGEREARDDVDVLNYPFMSCELGGGMMSSYHRRILIDPRDIETVALVKTGSGSNLPGYYMYHGGTNPQGKLTTLMEAQNTKATNSNDMPVKNYDFQAPLGQFGQVREPYHGLRRLHLFLRDFGQELAEMPASFPTGGQRKNDAEKPRYSVRSNGTSGYVFMSNYQRLLEMPARPNVQFDVKLANGSIKFPESPVNVPAGVTFFWPFNLQLGAGAKLVYATAQPICRTDDAIFFAQTPGVPAEFVIDASNTHAGDGNVSIVSDRMQFRNPKPGLTPITTVRTNDGKQIAILLLDDATSRQLWKGSIGGKDRVILSRGNLIFDGDTLRIQGQDPEMLTASVYENGTFNPVRIEPAARPKSAQATLEKVKDAGPLRTIKTGAARVLEQPCDEEFAQAAEWRVKFDGPINPLLHSILRVHYVGDVARAYAGETLLTDDFYNGRVFDVGLAQFAADLNGKDLTLKILPLQKDQPIYLDKSAWPDFGSANGMARIEKVEVVDTFEVKVKL
jgi:hypothetical protein